MALSIQATPKLNRVQTVNFVNRLWDEQNDVDNINIGDSVRETREKRKVAKHSNKK